ncbi:MAG: EscU/YscU/HrcU family type III secretion system export apparatus switch protein [Devosia sp.]|nr:EscU/YscU/HrcU family type III secretion system export apparatus switch protein [Devosia sp.]
MADNSDQDKTEEPTSKRLADAKKKGQIARSRELNTFAMLIASATFLLMQGQKLGEGLIARCGVPRQFLELAAHRRQAQLPQLGLEQFGRDIGHWQIPFWLTSSATWRHAKKMLTAPPAAGPLKS